MRVRVLFFGMLKDVVGCPQEDLDIDPGATLGRVFDLYGSRFPRLHELAGSIVLARNREFAEPSVGIQEGDEVAFLPPVSGGSRGYFLEIEEAGHFFALTREPIDAHRVASHLLHGEDGAV